MMHMDITNLRFLYFRDSMTWMELEGVPRDHVAWESVIDYN